MYAKELWTLRNFIINYAQQDSGLIASFLFFSQGRCIGDAYE